MSTYELNNKLTGKGMKVLNTMWLILSIACIGVSPLAQATPESSEQNHSKLYIPSEVSTTDEIHYYICRAFHHPIVIKQYNAKKPAKNGLLFQLINAVIFAYTYSMCSSMQD